MSECFRCQVKAAVDERPELTAEQHRDLVLSVFRRAREKSQYPTLDLCPAHRSELDAELRGVYAKNPWLYDAIPRPS